MTNPNSRARRARYFRGPPKLAIGLYLIAATLLTPAAISDEVVKATARCSGVASPLAFWLGEWDVYMDETLVGHNRISEVLPGCAVLEEWTDINGGRGISLFHPDQEGQWQQVWVTPNPGRPGGFKRKTLVRADDSSAIFVGEAWFEGESFPDRTTLTKNPDGSISQLIEFSSDGGKTWQTGFEARYVRRPPETFACGTLECDIATQYCHKAFPGAAIPNQPPSVDRCLLLPAPDCEEVARSGRCLGDAKSGLTIEVYFP